MFDAIESDGIEGDVLEHGLVVRGALGVRLHLVLRFRHLLEQHELCGAMLDVVNLYLDSKGIRISTGTI